MNAIKEMRKQKKLTNIEIASKLGVTAPYFNMIENNKRNPSWAFICKLRKAFPNFNVNKLVDEYIERSK